jgi:hypothetical protein
MASGEKMEFSRNSGGVKLGMPRKQPKPDRRDNDSPWKETLQHFLQAVVGFFFPALHDAIDWSKGYTALDKEFQQIVAKAKTGRSLADKLFKVWLRSGKEIWLLVHVEVQGQVDRGFGRRMFRYNVRCFDLYDRRVLSVAILCDDNKTWRPRGFAYGGYGSRTSIRFPTAKLLEYEGKEDSLAGSDNRAAHVVLAFLKARATRAEPQGRLASKIRLVKGLYDRGWSADNVRQLFRLVDWLMDLPKELQQTFRQDLYEFEEDRNMPYVTSVERLAKEEGREEGRQEGRQEGAREALLSAFGDGLKARFGSAGTRLLAKVQLIEELPRLRSLIHALWKVESIRAFRELLKN